MAVEDKVRVVSVAKVDSFYNQRSHIEGLTGRATSIRETTNKELARGGYKSCIFFPDGAHGENAGDAYTFFAVILETVG